MAMGVDAADLSDDDLRRELAQLKSKAVDIDSAGTPDQQANHRRRTAELEEEFLRRNPREPAKPDRERSAHVSAVSGGGSGQPAAADDVAPAGPNDGPVNDQPESDQPRDHPSTPPEPSDAPTDDPDRPANPA